MRYSEVVITLTDEVPPAENPEVRVLAPDSEVFTIVAVEFERDEQNGNDILWLKAEVAE